MTMRPDSAALLGVSVLAVAAELPRPTPTRPRSIARSRATTAAKRTARDSCGIDATLNSSAFARTLPSWKSGRRSAVPEVLARSCARRDA